MRIFVELAKRAFRRQINYRAATIAGLATNFAFGLLRAVLLIALYNQRPEMAGFSLQAAITFTALSQASIGYLSLFGWFDLMNQVYTGDIASDLLKPLDLFRFWLAKDFGRAAAAFLTRGITIVLAYELIVDLAYPYDPQQWALVGFSLIFAWLVNFSWCFLINLASFWTPNALGFSRFFFLVATFFSGMLMPLRFYPQWVSNLAYLSPFPHILNTPVEIYLGILSIPETISALLLQAAWAAVLIVFGQLILKSGVRRLVIQGG